MAIDYLKIYGHLLPRGRAWMLSVATSLSDFFSGLSTFPADIQMFFDGIWADLQPSLMDASQLPEWNSQWGLLQTSLTESDQRDRLAAQWSATGGQGVEYLQEVFATNGFDGVFIHEWFLPTVLTSPPTALTPRNPTLYINDGQIEYDHECSSLASQSQCSDPAVDDIDCGDFTGQQGILLVNLDGDGEPLAAYTVPVGPDAPEWRYFLYIGGPVFDPAVNGGPNIVSVPASRKSEFRLLMLKYCPGQNWIGEFIRYD